MQFNLKTLFLVCVVGSILFSFLGHADQKTDGEPVFKQIIDQSSNSELSNSINELVYHRLLPATKKILKDNNTPYEIDVTWSVYDTEGLNAGISNIYLRSGQNKIHIKIERGLLEEFLKNSKGIADSTSVRKGIEEKLAGVLAHEFAHLLVPHLTTISSGELKLVEAGADQLTLDLLREAKLPDNALYQGLSTLKKAKGTQESLLLSHCASHPSLSPRISFQQYLKTKKELQFGSAKVEKLAMKEDEVVKNTNALFLKSEQAALNEQSLTRSLELATKMARTQKIKKEKLVVILNQIDDVILNPKFKPSDAFIEKYVQLLEAVRKNILKNPFHDFERHRIRLRNSQLIKSPVFREKLKSAVSSGQVWDKNFQALVAPDRETLLTLFDKEVLNAANADVFLEKVEKLYDQDLTDYFLKIKFVREKLLPKVKDREKYLLQLTAQNLLSEEVLDSADANLKKLMLEHINWVWDNAGELAFADQARREKRIKKIDWDFIFKVKGLSKEEGEILLNKDLSYFAEETNSKKYLQESKQFSDNPNKVYFDFDYKSLEVKPLSSAESKHAAHSVLADLVEGMSTHDRKELLNYLKDPHKEISGYLRSTLEHRISENLQAMANKKDFIESIFATLKQVKGSKNSLEREFLINIVLNAGEDKLFHNIESARKLLREQLGFKADSMAEKELIAFLKVIPEDQQSIVLAHFFAMPPERLQKMGEGEVFSSIFLQLRKHVRVPTRAEVQQMFAKKFPKSVYDRVRIYNIYPATGNAIAVEADIPTESGVLERTIAFIPDKNSEEVSEQYLKLRDAFKEQLVKDGVAIKPNTYKDFYLSDDIFRKARKDWLFQRASILDDELSNWVDCARSWINQKLSSRKW